MSTSDTHQPDKRQRDLEMEVHPLGLGHLAEGLVDQRARTIRARVRGQTMVDVAAVLGQTGTSAEIAVRENDGSGWSMTVGARLAGGDATA